MPVKLAPAPRKREVCPISSVYQYFPDKRAILVALRRRHIEEIDRRIESAPVEYAVSPLDTLMRVLIDEMIAAHTRELELYELLMAEVPHRADDPLETG